MDETSHRRELEPPPAGLRRLLQRREIQANWSDGKVRGHLLSVEGRANWGFSREDVTPCKSLVFELAHQTAAMVGVCFGCD